MDEYCITSLANIVTKDEETLILNLIKPYKAPNTDGHGNIFKQYW